MYRTPGSAAAIAVREPLAAPAGGAEARVFQSLTVSAVRTLVARHAADAGMDPRRRSELVLAVSEVATNSVTHAGGWGLLRVWRDAAALVCEVADRGRGDWSLPAIRDPSPDAQGGYGLCLADRLCDRVEVRPGPAGTVVRLEMAL